MSFLKVLLLPPGLMFLVVLVGWLLHRRWRRTGRWLMGLGIISLYLASTPLVSGAALSLVERLTPRGNAENPEAIVVLGGTFDRGEEVDVGPETLQRMRSGLAAHRKTGLPLLVTAGNPGAGDESGAEIMARVYRRDLGCPVRWIEPTAANTWENASASRAMLAPLGIDQIILVTNRWHLPRATHAFVANGFRVRGYAAEPYNEMHLGIISFLPSADGLQTFYFAMYELAGMTWYEIRYQSAEDA